MSEHLPVVSGDEAVTAFRRAGFAELPARGKGHIILAKSGMVTLLSVPKHRELKRGLLRALIRKSGLNVAQFGDLL